MADIRASTEIDGVFVVDPVVHVDGRGTFVETWRREWDAETLFLEPASGAGLLVQPRPGRAVLMHQEGASSYP